MKTRKLTINVPNDLRLGQFLYNVLESNSYSHEVNIKLFTDGKYSDVLFKGIDCFYIEDEELLKMCKEWKDE